jgi:hypothetical protein
LKSLGESIGVSNYPKSSANEAAVSGIWSKAVANRAEKVTQNSGKLSAIPKPPQTAGGMFSGKLAALIAVGVLGLASVVFVAMSSPGPESAIEQKISGGSLTDAANMMENWHSGLKAGDEEKFAALALSLGKAYNDRHDTIESGRWLEQVPDGSKFAPEAKRLLKALKK